MKLRLRLPLLLSIGAVALLQCWHIANSQRSMVTTQRRLQAVWHACINYAQTHAGHYPDGNTSNQALRQLFIVGYIADENFFERKGIDKVTPDGKIGTKENGYLQALAPGECQVTYIRGIADENPGPNAPSLFTQTVGSNGDIWVIAVRKGGQSDLYRTSDGTVLQEQNGQQVDIFSEAYLKEKYGILPQDILKPEGPHRDITALARQRKMEILRIQAAIILLIWLPFLIPHWIKHRRKPKPHPETPTPQA